MKGGYVALVALGAAAVVLVGGALVLHARRAARAADPGAEAYQTVKVERGNMVVTVPVTGTMEPSVVTTIRPDPNMPTRTLTRLFVQVGDRVKAGQPLAAVDASGLDLSLKSAQSNYDAQVYKLQLLHEQPLPQDLSAAQATLVQAQLNLQQQELNLDRTKALADKGMATGQSLEDAQRQYDLTKAQLDAAQRNYDYVKAGATDDEIHAQQALIADAQNALQTAQLVYDSTTVRSPVSGVVTEVLVNLGDLVEPTTAIMTVSDIDPMVLDGFVDEVDIDHVHAGQDAVVTTDSIPGRQFAGTVTLIQLHATTQQNVTVFPTEIQVPNADGKLMWGMDANADVTIVSDRGVLLLPNNAIHTTAAGSTVEILDDGKPAAWDIQIGVTDGTKTEVLSGLDPGDAVIVPKSNAAVVRTQPQSPLRGAGPGGPNALFRMIGGR